MNPKRVLGLDPGLALLGFGLVNHAGTSGRGAQLLDFGVIETPARTTIESRLVTIYEDLHALIQDAKPDLVAVEKLFFYRMGNTINVAQARGVILLVLGQFSLPYIEFTPAQIKQALTGYGNAKKPEVQAAVAHELSLTKIPKPDDAADAIAVALAACFQTIH